MITKEQDRCEQPVIPATMIKQVFTPTIRPAVPHHYLNKTAIAGVKYPERELEFDLALYTGMRRGEQYSAKWEDVDWERHQLTIPFSKNGSVRHLPLNVSARQALMQLRSRGSDSTLICGGVKSPRGWFEPVVKAAGLRNLTWHSIRRTFASRLVMTGSDLRTVAELMGHKTLVMVMRYSHLAPDYQQEAVSRLEPTATRTATEQCGSEVTASVAVN